MKTSAIVMLFVLAAAVPSRAASCPDGETKFRNGIQYTCVCNTLSSGQKACVWSAD